MNQRRSFNYHTNTSIHRTYTYNFTTTINHQDNNCRYNCRYWQNVQNRPPVDNAVPSETILPTGQLPPPLRLCHPIAKLWRSSKWPECDSHTVTTSTNTAAGAFGNLHLAIMHATRINPAAHAGVAVVAPRPAGGHASVLPVDLPRYESCCDELE